MIEVWVVITVALLYMTFLFGVAYYGDRYAKHMQNKARPIIYSLSIAVYCTSWTFFGSVGLSATSGLDFIPVYLGAILMIALGWPLLVRIIKISKTQNITSIADFLAARYGKNQSLAAVVTIIAVIATLPYIALQLKAVAASVTTLIGPVETDQFVFGDIAFLTALLMALFSILFGTRHTDATEHQQGLMLAIATESIVKLLAFLTVGLFITFVMFTPATLFEQASQRPEIAELFSKGLNGGTWLTITFLSLVCIIILPRQFHVAVVENNSLKEVRIAAWLFPLYLIAINIFVVPIAVAGLLTFPSGSVNADMFVLALPIEAGAKSIALFTFIGGLSAATAMVIVSTIALAIMLSNDIVVPWILRNHNPANIDRDDMSVLLLNIRRTAIFIILILAYLFYKVIDNSYALASIGLLAFAASAQFAPAFFGGLLWRRGTAQGALAGILIGFCVWAYTLLLPALATSGFVSAAFIENGPFGIAILRPQMLFNLEFEPLTHGVLWSLSLNIAAYISFSLLRMPQPIERLQAGTFIHDDFSKYASPKLNLSKSSVTIEELQNTASRYLGEKRTARSFHDYAETRNIKLVPKARADVPLLRYTEHLLASAIGTASSRLVLSLLLRRHNVDPQDTIKLLDDASEAIHYNRDLLQSALDQVRQGISVFDENMRLICWNHQFRNLLNLPPELGRFGVRLDQIIRFNAERGAFGKGNVEDIVNDRVHKMVVKKETFQERLNDGERILEFRTNAMPQGGIVTTYADVTEKVAFAEALAIANENLERRVRERTAELTKVNDELARAKAKADEANLDKTRFLAAASHDILQPLNAARLYSSSLMERQVSGEQTRLINNVDVSLEAVEEILNALLDISRLDAGAMKPELSVFPMGEVLEQLELEFAPLAKEKGLHLKMVPSHLHVRSDRRLLRRVLQNFVSNAIKYTKTGRVLVGCRKQGKTLNVEVHDTGPGIPKIKHDIIFREFQRLDNNNYDARGLGLGLSIVERIGKVLKHRIAVSSEPKKGSVFSINLPIAEPATRHAAARGIQPHIFRAQQITGTFVLCIDNEPDILDGMKTLLSNWQCEVITALNINDAVKVVKKHDTAPDIILADYHMGEEIGLDAIKAVRAACNKDIPVVIITADHSPEVTQQVRSEDIQILRKPLKPAQLRALMAQKRLRYQAAE